MKPYIKLPVLFLFLSVPAILSAQNTNCNISKTFKVEKGSSLRVTNKYGDINIITGKDDSLSVCATITLSQDDEVLRKKSMQQISVSIEQSKDTIQISTVYDKKFFSETLRQGRKNFRVDYIIKLPVYENVYLSDEFGNISIEDLSGTINVRLIQGLLSAKNLTKGNNKPISSIFIDHGKAAIDEINWMTLSLFNCSSVNIGKAQALTTISSVSKIWMGDISSLVSNSKSDNYFIRSVTNLVLESAYSSFEIGELNGQLKSKETYGSLILSHLNKGFSNIDIVSSQTHISLTTGENTSFMADIIASDTEVEFTADKFPGIIKTDSNNSTALLGLAGTNKLTKSQIVMRAKGGKLTIQ
jgi:hypothetical protein